MENEGDKELPRCETKHNHHRRSFWHDYYQKGLYMVTMVIEGRQRLFGTIAGQGSTGTVLLDYFPPLIQWPSFAFEAGV